MTNHLSTVIVGNLALQPATLRKFLKKSHYWLTYSPEKELISLQANHGHGGETILEVRNASYENAVKMAEELGLTGDGTNPTSWSKWNPVASLHHDGSREAESLRTAMLQQGIPHNVVRVSDVYGLCLNGTGIMKPPMFSVDAMLAEITKSAERYRAQLETAP